MSLFNRSFVSLMALLWCAAIALGVYLVWEQGKQIAVNDDFFTLNLDLIFETRAEQILATIAAAALALPALLILGMEVLATGGYSRADQRRAAGYGALETRVDELQKRLDQERDARRTAERQVEHERSFVRDEARRNADVVRDTSGRVVTASDSNAVREVKTPKTDHRRRWHLLPRRS